VPADWNCGDVEFSVAHIAINELPDPERYELAKIPTRLTLSRGEIEAAIKAARQAISSLSEVRYFVESRIGKQSKMPKQ
jgi:hypothetical protein